MLDSEPALDESWEEIVEASFTPQTSDVSVTNFDGDEQTRFGVTPGVTYRTRLSALHMDEARDVLMPDEGQVVDSYLLSSGPLPRLRMPS